VAEEKPPALLARAVLERHDVRSPDDIHVERIACDEGAFVDWGETGSADARVVHCGTTALICVNRRLRRSARGRWSIAHELAHFLLGHDPKAIERIHSGGAKTKEERQLERAADAFAAALLMPDFLFAPHCDHVRPTVPDLDDLAALFGTSLTATAKRYPQFARSGCAAVECSGDRIDRAHRSAAFRGVAVGRRALEPASAAFAIGRGDALSLPRSVEGGAWGSAKLGGAEMTEHAILVPASGTTLVWLWHAAVAPRRRSAGSFALPSHGAGPSTR
jgi:hypothetical protein